MRLLCIILASLLLAACDWAPFQIGRPDGVPEDAIHTRTGTWGGTRGGAWVSCADWTPTTISNCSIRTRSQTETGRYFLDAEDRMGGVLETLPPDSNVMMFWQQLLATRIFAPQYVEQKEVYLVPLSVTVVGSEGFTISDPRCMTHLIDGDLQEFGAVTLRSWNLPLQTRLSNLFGFARRQRYSLEVENVWFWNGEVVERVNFTAAGTRYHGTVVGSCWGQFIERDDE